MKTSKKIIAIVLAVVMSFSFAVVAFADNSLNYLVLGDSIGYGAGVLNSDEAVFGRIVADTAGYNYKNDAINGYKTENLIALLEKDSVIEDVEEADIISISIGGNDFLKGGLPELIAQGEMGNFEQFDVIAAESLANFATIIETIKSINPDVQILCQTIYNPGIGDLYDIYKYALDLLNGGFAAYLEDHPGAYELIDVAAAFEGHSNYVAMDNIHPSAAGNIVIAQLIIDRLNSIGLTDATTLVLNADGINQSEAVSLKFILYIIRTLIAKLKAIFTFAA